MGILKGYDFRYSFTLPSDIFFHKVNILIDENCHARLADFGLLTIITDSTSFETSSSIIAYGTIRWMSPELLHQSQSDIKGSGPTKESDCYALGMVVYEVLSGKVPFAPLKDFIVMQKVVEGGHPERPEGVEGSWFADGLWGMLNQCWESQLKSRPSIKAVLECLEEASETWKPPPQQVNEDLEMDEDDWYLTEVMLPVCFLFYPLHFVFLWRILY